MMFLTMDELIEEFQRNPQCSSGRLRLDHYLILETTTDFADRFLTSLESQGILPSTCTWVSGPGKRVRLYQNPAEGNNWSISGEDPLGMQCQLGPKYDCSVRNIDNSVLISKVSALPQNTMRWLSMLPALAEMLTFLSYPPFDLGAKAGGSRQII
jgi:hypothetical protein